MKNIIPLFLLLILSSCASKQNLKSKVNEEYTLRAITENFDNKNLSYIGLKKYCVGGVVRDPNKNDCPDCYWNNDIYIFWTENEKSFVKKYDNCSEFNTIQISNFKLNEFLRDNSGDLGKSEIGHFKIGEDAYLSKSHSCFRNYIINDGQSKYEKEYDIYDLTGENRNLNYRSNNESIIVILDEKLDAILSALENENRFQRDKTTCYTQTSR